MCDLSQKKGIKWEDYPFARFNKKVLLLSYNDDEYEQLLRSEQWTRKQTASQERERAREQERECRTGSACRSKHTNSLCL